MPDPGCFPSLARSLNRRIRTRSGSDLWFLSYALLGFAQSGVLPILMPLAGHGATAGLTYAAFSLLGVLSPFLGAWADRIGCHRDLLAWGSALAGLLLLPMGAAPVAVQLVLAAGAGLGVAATTTAGNVLAIQNQIESNWDARVATLQRCISAGQVLGLVAAGVLARHHPSFGLAVAAIALCLAGLLGFVFAPVRIPRNPAAKPNPVPMVGGDAGVSQATHRAHHLTWSQLKPFLQAINRPLRQFLIVWMVAYPAMNGLAALFPVAMVHQFKMDPLWPACSYALGVGGSLLLYPVLGRAARQHGGAIILALGIEVRLLILGVMTAVSFEGTAVTDGLALLGFSLLQFVWPLLAVGANSLAVRLAPTARGESVGLFNAVTSLAAAFGVALAGLVVSAMGLEGLSLATVLTVSVALALSAIWRRGWNTALAGTRRE